MPAILDLAFISGGNFRNLLQRARCYHLPRDGSEVCAAHAGRKRDVQITTGSRYSRVKTARFATVVEKCGTPEIYLALMEPEKDQALQQAVKTQRVLTVSQESVGTKADRGEVGFEPGKSRQFLIFPKSLRAFASRTVVGVKYDLLGSQEVPKSKRAAPPRPPEKSKSKRPTRREKPEPEIAKKVVSFKPESPVDEDEEVADLKKQIRHAMALLEDGKAVAAFNLLKRTVGG